MYPTLSHSFATSLEELTTPVSGTPAPNPNTWIVNEDLATDLGFTPEWIDSEEGAAFLTAQVDAQHPGGGHPGVAQIYAGHQFGGYSPLLGDGRAMLLGEVAQGEAHEGLVDLHLKGSGPNRYSRGDGFATLDQCLRELIMGEFMHAVGIPTTRALAVVTTGRHLSRDNFEHDNVLPGAVLTRVASSHIRVGTFQFAKATGNAELLERLLRYAVSRHDPDLMLSEPSQSCADIAREFLSRVIDRQATLTASWMLAGFVHGVMNTDNMLVSGETIDYGPCAFLDEFDPGAVFSSIDHQGRYAYGRQPGIAKWNLARLADAPLPLLDPEQDEAIRIAEGSLARYDNAYNEAWLSGIRKKLGLTHVNDTELTRIAQSLFDVLTRERLDYTGTFVTLTRIAGPDGMRPVPESEAFRDWAEAWLQLGPDHKVMREHNSIYIPRNHHVQRALDEVLRGNREPFDELLDAVSHPTRFRPEYAHLETPGQAPGSAPGGRFVTYCGT